MYTLQDTWIWAYGMSRYKGWNDRFLCIETDKETTFLTNTLPGTLAAYGFTIVLNGSFTVLYSGREISIERNHLLITMPGFHLRILAMEALWLLENTSLSIDEIAERIHYADSTTFGRFFPRMKGVTPREYRKNL